MTWKKTEELTKIESRTSGLNVSTRTGLSLLPDNLEVDEQPLQGSVGVVDHQVKVELLDEQKFVLQDLLQNPLLPCWALLNEVADKLGAGHVELVHFAGQVRTRQPETRRRVKEL